ncbi:FAD/NAD-P-binding domain-containing protein [Gymnopus androsaceus JB14]|uniref:FAD/NAD-P-binding domain-containing protein n=1 Tax=Gymnopus androsaceus JB14 TaxID=1447944 RepID=A0A6A4HWD0_9AGAR|nr:FAD/NAD-P-binding domain-containing protein [Gymnopus androsaceus JB14]
MTTMENKPNIVVIGGSYVGNKAIEVITPLVHKTHNVVLVEKNSHFRHLFAFPRIHAVTGFEHKAFIPYAKPGSTNPSSFFSPVNAAATSSTTEAVGGFTPLPSDSIKIVNAAATSILADKVILGDGKDSIPYDFLVLATGTGPAGHSGLVGQDKKAGVEISHLHQENVKKAKNIVIVGGGAYGIQLATDLKTHTPTQSKHVTVVHSRPQLLNRFHEGLHDIALSKCKELDIEVVLAKRVIVPEGGFSRETADEEFDVQLTGGGSVRGDLVILCTGSVPLSSPLKALAPSAIDGSGYIRVKPTLQVDAPGISNIFALGDVADTGAHKAARPGHAQAIVLAGNIEKLIGARAAGESNPEKLDEYKADGAGIHLSLGLNESLKFRNPTAEDAKPWVMWDEPGSQKHDAGCSRIWTVRAPWAGPDAYHL